MTSLSRVSVSRSNDAALGGGGKIGKYMKQKKNKPKSTLFTDNTQGLITTKQTKLKPVASADQIEYRRGYLPIHGLWAHFKLSLKITPRPPPWRKTGVQGQRLDCGGVFVGQGKWREWLQPFLV